MLTKKQKKDTVDLLLTQLGAAKAGVFSGYQGLSTADTSLLRRELGKEGISYKVVKLTLLKKALARAGIDTSSFNFTVPLSISLSKEDEVATAKIIANFAKKHDKLQILGGILDRKLISAAEVKNLSVLPSKQELLGQVVGVIASPLRGLVTVLSGNIRGLLNVLNAIKDAKV